MVSGWLWSRNRRDPEEEQVLDLNDLTKGAKGLALDLQTLEQLKAITADMWRLAFERLQEKSSEDGVQLSQGIDTPTDFQSGPEAPTDAYFDEVIREAQELGERDPAIAIGSIDLKKMSAALEGQSPIHTLAFRCALFHLINHAAYEALPRDINEKQDDLYREVQEQVARDVAGMGMNDLWNDDF